VCVCVSVCVWRRIYEILGHKEEYGVGQGIDLGVKMA